MSQERVFASDQGSLNFVVCDAISKFALNQRIFTYAFFSAMFLVVVFWFYPILFELSFGLTFDLHAKDNENQ